MGNIVFDPSNYTQNSTNTAKTILQLSEDFKQTQHDLQQIQQLYHLMEQADLNLKPVDALYNSRVLTLENQLNSADTISYDVQTLNAGFQATYPEWTDDEGLSTAQYNERITGWRRAARGAVKNSFTAQAIKPVIDQGRLSLQNLLTQNASVTGELQGIQVLTQVAGLMVDQMLTLNQMTSQQYRAQSQVLQNDIEQRREAEEWVKRSRCGALDNC